MEYRILGKTGLQVSALSFGASSLGGVFHTIPEILCNQNHTYSIDYYAVGIIAFELAYGHRPYIGRSKHEVKQLILSRAGI